MRYTPDDLWRCRPELDHPGPKPKPLNPKPLNPKPQTPETQIPKPAGDGRFVYGRG